MSTDDLADSPGKKLSMMTPAQWRERALTEVNSRGGRRGGDFGYYCCAAAASCGSTADKCEVEEHRLAHQALDTPQLVAYMILKAHGLEEFADQHVVVEEVLVG